MTALFRIALLIWVATFCLSAQAQKPGADVRVRIHAREALNTFYQSGAVELRRMSEFCYASNFAAPQTPISNNDVPKNLALERCVTYDSVGLILYTLQKRMMETQFNKPFNEPYFNQEDEQERQNIYLGNSGIDIKRFSDFVFSVTLDEFRKSSAAPKKPTSTPESK